MNRQRPNEVDARQIVERLMGIQLEHADIHGGVDYKSKDGTVALEVTAVTNGEKEGVRKALSKSKARGSQESVLQGCWIVFAPDTQPQMKTFVQRVQPAIAKLELAGETRFEDQLAMEHLLEKGALSHIYLPLLQAGVERASTGLDQKHPDPDHIHQLFISTGSGGSVGGSDESLDRLLEELDKKSDNPAKLCASGADQRHLFVWLDDDSPYNIARPLSREAPSWADEGWGTPTSKPQLGPAITHLWVVHERSRFGWLWDGDRWQELRDL